METKLGEMELRLAGVESIISTRDKEIVELKAALEESENNWYNMGFANAENSTESVMFQSRQYEFGEGWMAAVSTLGVLNESPFRNPNQIPYPKPPPPNQNPIDVDEEDTPSMRELMQEIDSYNELVDLKITSDLNAVQGLA